MERSDAHVEAWSHSKHKYAMFLVVLTVIPIKCHQLKHRFFHVVERTRTSSKCQKMKSARAKRAKILFSLSNMQICGGLVAVVVVVA